MSFPARFSSSGLSRDASKRCVTEPTVLFRRLCLGYCPGWSSVLQYADVRFDNLFHLFETVGARRPAGLPRLPGAHKPLRIPVACMVVLRLGFHTREWRDRVLCSSGFL